MAQVEFPLAESSGFLVRDANRAFQRLLEKRIASYGVARGQWYFLRVLWNEDGLSQRELSARVGTMEPTTVIALRTRRISPDFSMVRNAMTVFGSMVPTRAESSRCDNPSSFHSTRGKYHWPRATP